MLPQVQRHLSFDYEERGAVKVKGAGGEGEGKKMISLSLEGLVPQ